MTEECKVHFVKLELVGSIKIFWMFIERQHEKDYKDLEYIEGETKKEISSTYLSRSSFKAT